MCLGVSATDFDRAGILVNTRCLPPCQHRRQRLHSRCKALWHLRGSAATFEAQVSGTPVPEPRTVEDFLIRATNGAGQATSTAELLVTAETAPPNFIQRLQSMIVRQGSQVRTGYSGTYSVNATNSSGRATSTAELLVQGEEEAVPAKKTKTVMSTTQVSRQTRVEKRMEGHFQAGTKSSMEMYVEGAAVAHQLPHKTPPRVPPKPTSRSPPSLVSKVAATRHQSPSPVRHVKAPTPTPVSAVSASSTRLSVSPIRPVKSPVMTRKQITLGPDVLPPWKQEDYTEASFTRMTAGAAQLQTTATHVHMEQRWEGSFGMQQQQVAGGVGVSVKEVQNIKIF
ncbi:hypothetical protein SKAU_G00236670 [Synaphobranchus kaupii]|uniref:Uncharacterized protein n=1 Tax=Synaphobranchus kaupii TaxID=118154 RepID=A0A9Q1F745_SYNKA|nr:hypothetical protein SKAU_G00236670 [Synaphobranchus kaupii]